MATASLIGGKSATAAAPITVAPAGSAPVELHADPADGVAPLVVTWKVVNNTGRALLQYELDQTGGGTFCIGRKLGRHVGHLFDPGSLVSGSSRHGRPGGSLTRARRPSPPAIQRS